MKDETELISGLKKGNEKYFSLLFQQYYTDLVLFAGIYISEKSVCEDIVQSVFLKIWDKRATLTIKTSFKSFLLKSVRNKCMDVIRHDNVVNKYEIFFNLFDSYSKEETEHYILYSDLQAHLQKALQKVPDRYKETFELSRIKGLKYKEIAKEQNISERAVEERMSKTLKLLRKHLKDFIIPITFFYIFFNLLWKVYELNVIV